MSTLAVIPARGGSKRLPRKNVLGFRGRPMLAWTVEAARAADVFDAVLVSTEDDEIAAAARAAGAAVRARPAALAGDAVPVAEVLADLLRGFDPLPDAVCLLMPNCPLRTGADIADALARHRATGADVTMSVVAYDWRRPGWALRAAGSWLRPVDADALGGGADPARLVCPSGAIRWVKPAAFLAAPGFYPARLAGHELPWHRAIDIDEAADLEMAACVAHALDHGFRFAA